jgi:exopolysaccharide production protein ExoZ
MLLALAFRAGLRLPAAVRLALVVAGPVLVPFMFRYFTGGPEWRALTFGVPALLLMAGATLGDFSPKGVSWRALAAVGNASYALYLFHSFSVRAVLYGTRWLGLDATKAYWVLLPLAVAGAIALALALYYFFERPLTKALRDLAATRNNVALAEENAAIGTVHDADHDRHSRI